MTKLIFYASDGKRKRLINSNECKFDLEKELPLLFSAFSDAVTLFEKEIVLTPVESRCRGFEASLLNSKIMMCIQKYFPDNWKLGKYRRFFLRINSYIILFKKLNSKDFPMNIKTRTTSSIYNQQMGSLFGEGENGTEPILFFGYKKGKFGEILESKLIYIDENCKKWQITQNEIDISNVIKLNVNMQNSKSSNLIIKDKGKEATGTNS